MYTMHEQYTHYKVAFSFVSFLRSHTLHDTAGPSTAGRNLGETYKSSNIFFLYKWNTQERKDHSHVSITVQISQSLTLKEKRREQLRLLASFCTIWFFFLKLELICSRTAHTTAQPIKLTISAQNYLAPLRSSALVRWTAAPSAFGHAARRDPSRRRPAMAGGRRLGNLRSRLLAAHPRVCALEVSAAKVLWQSRGWLYRCRGACQCVRV